MLKKGFRLTVMRVGEDRSPSVDMVTWCCLAPFYSLSEQTHLFPSLQWLQSDEIGENYPTVWLRWVGVVKVTAKPPFTSRISNPKILIKNNIWGSKI